MKMKNMLIGGMSLALVACISVGATLAYLSDKTEAVTNTVKFTTNGIKLTLTESSQSDEAGAKKGQTVTEGYGIDYTDVVPGADLDKQPVLTVEKDNVDCYVYALVTGIDTNTGKVMYTKWNDTYWEVVPTAGLVTDVEKQFPENAVLLRYKDVVDENKINSTELPAIFTTVTINDDLEYDAQNGKWMLNGEKVSVDTTNKLDDSIVIKGYAIQANNLTDSTDSQAAIAVANTEAANAFAVAKTQP